MKKLSLILIGLLFVPTLFLTSCDEGETVEVTETFKLLKNHMITEGYDINKIIKNSDDEKFVAFPKNDDYQAFIDKYYIIDIRTEAAYNTGHIEGAKLVPFANILDEGAAAKAAGKPALVVCFTGQTACYATALMRMYGYKHTQALKWGMSGWNSNLSTSWDNNIGNIADGHPNWSKGGEPSTPSYGDPEIGLSEIGTDVNDLFKKRIRDAVAAGFDPAGVSGSEVLNNPTSYFINNYFSAPSGHYTSFGHINGAYRINPLVLSDNSYNKLDPTKKVVTYCYTGQTSAVVTACLRVLGYDALSLKFGMNGLYNSNNAWDSTINNWGGDSNPKNYPVID